MNRLNRIFQTTLAFCIFLLFSFGAVAQQIQENNLVPPSQITSISGSLLGSGISDAGNIYYGATPSNLRAGSPVIVFIHGYFSRASSWWILNDMYTKAFNDGYRTAFVSVHPDKNMWVNGQLFSNMLGTITNHLGVNKVVVVAHSKGGLDTDAAVVHYGAHTKVERVITLSTPHYGTPLADLAQSGWVSWLSSVFGQVNDATFCLQTGYASGFRTQTANHPNYSKAKFRTVGAWGYGVLLSVPGAYLDWNGGGPFAGGNDGVVTYKSSKRPNAMHLLGGFGNWTTNVNHLEIQQGSKMWSTIKSNLPYNLSKEAAKPVENDFTNPNAVIESRVQVISSEKTSRNFMVEKGVTETMLDIHSLNANEEFVIIAPNGEKVSPKVLRASEEAGDLIGGFATTLSIQNPQVGTYSIESKSAFVALVTANEGVTLRMTSDLNDKKQVYNVGETINLNISLINELGINTKGAKVTGAMTLTSNDVKSQNAVVLEFKQNNGQFTATVNDKLEAGIYNIAIQAENGNFSKSLVTSIAVVDGVLYDVKAETIIPTKIDENSIESIKLMPSFPNPFNAHTTISFELKSSSPAVLTIYDAVGRVVETVDLASYGIGTHQYTWNVNQNKVKNGLYIAEIRNGSERVTQTMVYSK
ncbi:T9SS type A sorting domain-containing protein [Bernardetia sp. OM2101]|uniref:T9SS type A sorting domain-containing protein n=1 Tax=Bernardetia sp. OM2101 TaxID=3344876 RepID=UPI0035D06715